MPKIDMEQARHYTIIKSWAKSAKSDIKYRGNDRAKLRMVDDNR